MFANQAAVAIANARAFEELEDLRSRLERENAYLHEQVREGLASGEIVGESPILLNVLRQVEMVARTDAAVLITGESGTGKELVARAIHENSLRRDRPLVTVNCATVPHELFESEFFGHVKGAFTGALRDRAGRFQLADGGTIFLDEVGEIPLGLQSKLLRVLQEKQVERVGEDRVRQLDVRVISATNLDLLKECEAGRFRRDLYYRLSVFPIQLPPLRDRREDIGPLAAHYLDRAARRLNCPEIGLTNQALDLLTAYDWPGNVRELHNVIERAIILTQRGPLRIDLVLGNGAPSSAAGMAPSPARGTPVLSGAELARRERDNILAALERTGWKISGPDGAAQMLGVKPTTLASRLKRFGIERGR
jgi:transcriptional regulator with GAF, ATPase, and Fis domain